MKHVRLWLLVMVSLWLAPAALATHQEDCETVVVEEAFDEVIPGTPSQHYVHAHNEGDDPLGNDEVPLPPSEDPDVWQANTEQEPHLNNPNVTWVDEFGVGLHYTSHGSSGRRDWFYFDAGTEEQVIHHDAVTEEVCTPIEHEPSPTPEPPVDEPPVDEPPVERPVKNPDILPVTGPVQDAILFGAIALVLALAGTWAIWVTRKRRGTDVW